MKLIFICGSLDPGHDGVGDYVRRLANELNRQNHQVLALSVNDYGVNDTWLGAQQVGEGELQVLRLSSTMPWDSRITLARKWITEFGPDLLSLQFVPFAFHSKGLPFGIIRNLVKMNPGVQWEIMFHELWVGMDLDASPKLRLWGWVQKQIIKTLIRTLKPFKIHTQTQIYKQKLKDMGFSALHLPLFSNIPYVGGSVNDQIQNQITFVVFGTIHPGAPIGSFAKEAAEYARSKGMSILFKFIGRNGAELDNWMSILNAEGLKFVVKGEVESSEISLELQNSSVGISTTPLALVEKSGTVAAMREHGLPVICISRSWKVYFQNDVTALPDVFDYQSGDIARFINLAKQSPSDKQLSTVARKFSDDVVLDKSNNIRAFTAY